MLNFGLFCVFSKDVIENVVVLCLKDLHGQVDELVTLLTQLSTLYLP
jgi:hypothetical protein